MRITIVPLLPTVAALTLAAAFVGCSSGGGGSEARPERNDLNGTWLLNDLESDDPREFFEGPTQVDPSLPGGNRQRVAERVSGILAAARVFRIEQTDSTVTVVLQDGSEVMFFPDNREVENRVEGLGIVTTRARWRGDSFQVVRKLEGGTPTITTTYELRDEGRKLIVKFNMSSPGRSTKFERVYDAAPR
jgi:predicted ATP-grasp superfamily ATP-dependent carboligase